MSWQAYRRNTAIRKIIPTACPAATSRRWRWRNGLRRTVKCIVFDEPTRGVDVGAKTEIYKVINTLAEKGVAVIMISSEMPEVIGMCDRVMVMRNGKISGEVGKDELSEETLIKFAMGV